MAKPKIPNQKNKYSALNKRLAEYVALVRRIYDALNLEASKMAVRVKYKDEGKAFYFKDYPELTDRVKKLQTSFVEDISAVIYRGTSQEWRNSNLVQDLIADKVLKTYGVHFKSGRHKKYYQINSDALKAFQERKDRGMNLSQKLWNQSQNYKEELEYAISSAIQKGTSAVTLSKRISKYLNDFKSLQKDYKAKYGKAVECHDCEYRSIRLARSEINMAYRTAEQKRWQQFDFVVGQEIKLSNNHTCNGIPFTDICDDLKGKYPKDFKFTGWHPMCRCYVIPILKTEEEFWVEGDVRSQNNVDDIPPQFKEWISDNKDRINKAKAKGTLPYFVRDNIEFVELKNRNKKEREFNSSDYEHLTSMGFRFKGFSENVADEYNKSAIKGFDLKLFDEFLESICDTNGVMIKHKTISKFKSGNVNLSYVGRNEKGELFELTRNFLIQGDERIVMHSSFKLPEGIQGKGISKNIMKELFRQYEKMGIDSIQLYANIEVGGYAWAKYGFSAVKEEAEFIIDNALNDELISKIEYNTIKELIGKHETLFPMNIIANMNKGKDILLGSWWNGFFDMKDKKQLVYLKDYMGF